jgi:LPXTG-site transpeptidase (sortase) family protein
MSKTVVDVASNPESVTSPRGRLVKTVRILGWTCLGLGVFLLGFVAHQLFFTTWLAQQNNTERSSEAAAWFASAEIDTVEYVPGSGDPGSGEPSVGGDPVPLLVEAPPPDGEAFAIIRIPSIERLSEGWAVVEGVTRADLRNGAGHMPSTALPGQPGNAVISGHRTTYGAPFHELDELKPGDRIEVETAIGVHAYAVRETVIVRPTEFWVIQDRPGAWLTLTTCHPKFSSRQRMIVFAELVEGPNAEALGVS